MRPRHRRHRHQGGNPGHAGADAGAGRAAEQARGGEHRAADRKLASSRRPSSARRRDRTTSRRRPRTCARRPRVGLRRARQGQGRRLGHPHQVQGRLPHPRREHREGASSRAPTRCDAIPARVADAATASAHPVPLPTRREAKVTDTSKVDLPARDAATGPAVDQPDADQRAIAQGHLASTWPTPTGTFMDGGNSAARQAAATRSGGRPRACSTTATSIRKAPRSPSTAACSSAARYAWLAAGELQRNPDLANVGPDASSARRSA